MAAPTPAPTRSRARPRAAFAAVAAAVLLLVALVLPAAAQSDSTSRLSHAQVSPRRGTQATPITFRVTYHDRDDVEADWVSVMVDGDALPLGRDSGTPRSGVTYSTTATLAPGSHTVIFKASRSGHKVHKHGGQVHIRKADSPAPTDSPEPDPTKGPQPDPTDTPKPDPTETPKPDPTPPPRPTAVPTADPVTPTPTPASPPPSVEPTESPAPSAAPSPTPHATSKPDPRATADPATPAPDPDGTAPPAGPSDPAGPGNGQPDPSPDGVAGIVGSPEGGAGGGVGGAPDGTAGGPATGAVGTVPGDGPGGVANQLLPVRVESPGGSTGTSRGGLSELIPFADAFGPPGSPARMIPVAVVTSTTTTLLMAFLVFGRRRREQAPPGSDAELAAAAASPYEYLPAQLVPAFAGVDPGTGGTDIDLPRWRRPSLLAARSSNPTIAEAGPRQRLLFDPDESSSAPHDRQYVRYRIVKLLDQPDELLGNTVGHLDAGDEVEILEKRGTYRLVLTPEGRTGWVHRMVLADRSAPERRTGDDEAGPDLLSAYLAARGRPR